MHSFPRPWKVRLTAPHLVQEIDLINHFLDASVLNGVLDSAAFQKSMGGAKSFLPEEMKSFWRETQHLPHIPTCVLRGVHEVHTTPESLEMLCNLLTKQSGSALHDSQVHVHDAVGYPVYVRNRNGRLLKSTDMGGAIQRSEWTFFHRASCRTSLLWTCFAIVSLPQRIIGVP